MSEIDNSEIKTILCDISKNIILPQMELYAKTFPTYFKELNNY